MDTTELWTLFCLLMVKSPDKPIRVKFAAGKRIQDPFSKMITGLAADPTSALKFIAMYMSVLKGVRAKELHVVNCLCTAKTFNISLILEPPWPSFIMREK